MAEKKFNTTLAENRKARHDYTVLETIECGMVLSGTEVKSIRHGEVSLSGSYGAVLRGELWLVGADIAAYKFGNRFNHDVMRMRRLLLHKKEIMKLFGLCGKEGFTLVPLKMYFSGSKVKVQLGLCKGKKNYDKRETEAKKQAGRDIERALKERQR